MHSRPDDGGEPPTAVQSDSERGGNLEAKTETSVGGPVVATRLARLQLSRGSHGAAWIEFTTESESISVHVFVLIWFDQSKSAIAL